MAITLRTPGLLLDNTGITTTKNVPTPTSFAANDILCTVLNINSKSTTVTTPTGWTLTDDISTSVALGNRVRVYTRVADGTEGASVAFVLSVAKKCTAIMYGIVGANQSATPNQHATQDNATSATAQVMPAVTPTAADCLIISYVAAFINGSYTPDGAETEDADQATTDVTMEVSHVQLSGGSGSAQGPYTATASTTAASISGTLAWAPAASASIYPLPQDPLMQIPQFTVVRM